MIKAKTQLILFQVLETEPEKLVSRPIEPTLLDVSKLVLKPETPDDITTVTVKSCRKGKFFSKLLDPYRK